MKVAQQENKSGQGFALNLNQQNQQQPKMNQFTSASETSLGNSYQVPALDGKFIQAHPLKLCLKYRPPTIAVVYKLDPTHRTIPGSKSIKKYDKKYIHEIFVDHMNKRTNLKQMCDKLC